MEAIKITGHADFGRADRSFRLQAVVKQAQALANSKDISTAAAAVMA